MADLPSCAQAELGRPDSASGAAPGKLAQDRSLGRPGAPVERQDLRLHEPQGQDASGSDPGLLQAAALRTPPNFSRRQLRRRAGHSGAGDSASQQPARKLPSAATSRRPHRRMQPQPNPLPPTIRRRRRRQLSPTAVKQSAPNPGQWALKPSGRGSGPDLPEISLSLLAHVHLNWT